MGRGEIMEGLGEAEPPKFDSWPPPGWFQGFDAHGEGGAPFDWACPPRDFSVEEAYRYVERVARLYRAHEADGSYNPIRNGHEYPAVSNAYLLVRDLRRRSLVPQDGLRTYRLGNPLDPEMEGFEPRALTEASDWLGKQAERARQKAETDAARHVEMDRREAEVRDGRDRYLAEQHRLRADYGNGTITFQRITYSVGDVQAAFVHVLLEAQGNWLSLRDIKAKISELPDGVEGAHLERVRDSLPKEIRALVEVTHRGHRIIAP